MVVDVVAVDDGWQSAVNLTGDQFGRTTHQAREIFIRKIPNMLLRSSCHSLCSDMEYV
jgi:hypothetical protein